MKELGIHPESFNEGVVQHQVAGSGHDFYFWSIIQHARRPRNEKKQQVIFGSNQIISELI